MGRLNRGHKEQKERITLGLCINSTGTEWLKPIITKKANKPRCFGKTWKPDVVHCFHNKNVYMTSVVSMAVIPAPAMVPD